MQRILKPTGISLMDGIEKKPGEFHCNENGRYVIHSLFSDIEMLQYCLNWQVLQMDKQSSFSPTEVHRCPYQNGKIFMRIMSWQYIMTCGLKTILND